MNKFCIIGLGSHARNKIIPSIKKIKNSKIISVTRSKNNTVYGIKNFNNILELKKTYLKNYLFIIATPPESHFKILKFLLKNNCMIAVEKPAIINRSDFLSIKKNYNLNKILLIETFYYKLSKLYNKFLLDWHKYKSQIKNIDIIFLIPTFPVNSFRDYNEYWISYILDIGCYPIDILNSMNLKLNKPTIKIFKKQIKINFTDDNIKINIKIGIGEYTNKIILNNLKNNYTYEYSPIFYSRSGIRYKSIFYKSKFNKSKIIINKYKESDLIKKFYSSNKNFFKKLSKISINNLDKSSQMFSNLKKNMLLK